MEAEIKVGDYFYHGKYGGVAKKATNNYENHFDDMWLKKITAYHPLTKEAEELDLPKLPNPFKDEFNNINELAIKHWESRTYEDMDICCDNFIAGYKAAQSKQFSLEDMKKAIEMAREIEYDILHRSSDWNFVNSEEEIIQ